MCFSIGVVYRNEVMSPLLMRTREVFGLTVSQETYNVLKPLVQIVSRVSTVDIDVAISYIAGSSPNFIQTDSQLAELVSVFEKISQASFDRVQQALIAYYRDAAPSVLPTITESLNSLRQQRSRQQQQLTVQTTAPPQTPTARSLETPTKRSAKRVEVVQNPLARNLARARTAATDGRLAYQRQLAESPESYSRPLQYQLEVSAAYHELQKFEGASLQLSWKQVGICSYHPGLQQLAPPPSKAFPRLKARAGAKPYDAFQIDNGFQNESHDDPDLYLDVPEYYKQLTQYQQPYLSVFACPQYVLSTKKPVPQHHALIDLIGVYVTREAIASSLLTELKTYQNLTYLDVIQRLSLIRFFAPFQLFVDQRHYGCEGRFIRFAEEHESCYLKAVGIGGSLRLQAHAAKDIAKNQTLSLSMDYFPCTRGSILFEKMVQLCRMHCQLDRAAVEEPWMSVLNERIPRSSELYGRALDASRAAYYLDFSAIYAVPLMQKVSADELEVLLYESLRGGTTPNKFHDIAPLENPKFNPGLKIPLMANFDLFGKEAAEPEHKLTPKPDVLTTKLSSDQQILGISTEPQEATWAYPIMNAMHRHQLLQQPAFNILMSSLKQLYSGGQLVSDFCAMMHNFCVLKLQYFVGNGRSPAEADQQLIQKTQLAPCGLYLKEAPGYFPNFVPYAAFEPATYYAAFDRFATEKIYLTTFNLVVNLLRETAVYELKEILKEDVITKLVLRFMHQNSAFHRQCTGATVSIDEYVSETMKLLNEHLYVSLDQSLQHAIPFSIDMIRSYLAKFPKPSRDTTEILTGFTIPDPVAARDLTIYESELMVEECVRFVCEFIQNALAALPPLSKKMKVERKDIYQQRTEFAEPGYDGGYGQKAGKLPVKREESEWPPRAEPTKQLFQGAFWDFARLQMSDGYDAMIDQMLEKHKQFMKQEEEK